MKHRIILALVFWAAFALAGAAQTVRPTQISMPRLTALTATPAACSTGDFIYRSDSGEIVFCGTVNFAIPGTLSMNAITLDNANRDVTLSRAAANVMILSAGDTFGLDILCLDSSNRDACLSRGAADRLDLATGDTLRLDALALNTATGDVSLSRGAANRADLGAGDKFYAENINETRYAQSFAGANAGAKIAAAIANLPSTGGVVDARGLEGAQTFSADPFVGVNKPIVLITGAATYSWDTEALAVILPSDFTWILNNTTLQTSAVGKGGFSSSNQGLLNLRQTSTTGSITTGTNTLTVASATNFDVGDLVGVIGAVGGDANQRTTLVGAHTAGVTTLTVVSTSGWGSGTNYLLLNGLELVRCDAIAGATFTACTRGLYGTTAVAYVGGETVDAVSYFISPITAVSGTTVTLEDNASKTVTSADVTVGSTNVSIVGRGVLDGRVNRAVGASLGLVGIESKLGSRLYVGPEIVIKGVEASGIQLNGSWRNQIYAAFEGNGRPAASLGFDVIVFGRSHYNIVSTAWHRDGNQAVTIDDRTTVYSLFSGAGIRNKVDVGPVVINYVGGLNLQGAKATEARTGYISATIAVTVGGGQWTSTVAPQDNVVYAGPLDATTAISITSEALNGNNAVIAPRIVAGTIGYQAGNIIDAQTSADTLSLYRAREIRNSAGQLLHLFKKDGDAQHRNFLDQPLILTLSSGSAASQNNFINFDSGPTNIYQVGKTAAQGFVIGETGVANRLELDQAGTSTIRTGAVGGAVDLRLNNGTLLARFLSTDIDLAVGLKPDGSGVKHSRATAGCATAASVGATCDTTVTWGTAFGDTNYTVGCHGEGITSGVPVGGGVLSKLAASVQFRTVAVTAAAAQYTNVACVAVHD